MSYQTYYSPTLPPLSRINKILIIGCGIIFLLQSILDKVEGAQSLATLFGLSYTMVSKGYVYQFLTYPLLQTDFLSLLFNGMVLWFIGSEIEHNLGTRLYFWLLLTCVLMAGVSYYLIIFSVFYQDYIISSLPLLGIGGICTALLLIYSLWYGDRILSFMLIFPIKARYFCWILIAMELYLAFFSSYSKSSWGHLGAMLGGYIFIRWGGFLGAVLSDILTLRYFFGRKNSPYSPDSDYLDTEKKRSKRRGGHLKLIKNQDSNNSDHESQGPKYWQ